VTSQERVLVAVPIHLFLTQSGTVSGAPDAQSAKALKAMTVLKSGAKRDSSSFP